MWVKVLCGKYAPGGFDLYKHKVDGSSVWRAVLQAKTMLLEGFSLKVGSGDVSFFFDRWMSNEPLCRKVPDGITWQGDVSGVYSAKSGYGWLINRENADLQDDSSWLWIWKLKLPFKLNYFLWLVCHSALPTNALRVQRRCTNSDICGRCGVVSECIFHCLRDCCKVRAVWKVVGMDSIPWFWNEHNLVQWLKNGVDNFGITFITVLWWIWRARCAECIANENIEMMEILRLARLMQEDIHRVFGVSIVTPKEVRWVS
ncbi:hypothetical protein RIF29_38118 [Crotalaria pallida]|uniref:Reverse transcriptase zinc-binding domain-containing protein n=1 Tax=Crotalaria pallida TaxID=3830 RepID=A0AAN9E446_CROPI